MPRTTDDDAGLALRTANPADRVALRGVRLLSRLSGMSQRTTIEQTFVNLEPRAIEAVYTFPLPESAAVCGFEVVTADRVLTGTVDEADAAEEKYDEAISDGHGAFLAEQHRPDVFSVRVGNLEPKQAATIRLTYVCPLERVDKQIRVAFPTTVAPRYATAAATDPIDATIDADALNPPHVLSVPYGLTMHVEVDLGRELVGVFSPSHAIDVAQDESGKTIVTTPGGSLAEMNRDVVLTLRLAKEAEPRVQAATGPDGASYLAVTFVPEFDESELGDPEPNETVFVLDCSGSMMGPSIAQAKAALELCLRSLSPGDTFNICRFGSSFELLASEPLPYTQTTLDRALKYVRATGDLGGTELHAPLQAVMSAKPRAGGVRQVVLLTDGQVTNEPAILELARKHRAHNRVFSFGIGAGVSTFLVKGVARATGGAAEFIADGERIDDKVLRTFARLASPTATDVSLDWDGAEVQTLAEIPPVFDGDVMAVFGRCQGTLPRHATLSCRVNGTQRSWRLHVPPAAADDGGVVATMWARWTIQSLEEVAGAATVRSRKQNKTREQETIVRLSKQFNLLSSLTAFVSVEHRTEAERNDGQPALRRVPVALAEGWGGVMEELACSMDFDPEEQKRGISVSGAAMAAPPPAAWAKRARSAPKVAPQLSPSVLKPGSPPPPMSAPAAGAPMPAPLPPAAPKKRGLLGEVADALGGAGSGRTRGTKARYADPSLDATVDRSMDKSMRSFDRGEPTPPYGGGGSDEALAADLMAEPAPEDDLQAILSLQNADGSFGYGPVIDRLTAAAGGDALRATVDSAIPASITGGARSLVSLTSAVLVLLSSRLAEHEPLWRRAAKKAVRSFLAKALGMSAADAEAWVAKLRADAQVA